MRGRAFLLVVSFLAGVAIFGTKLIFGCFKFIVFLVQPRCFPTFFTLC